MKKLLAILKWTGIGLMVIVIALVLYVTLSFPPTFDAPQVELRASTDSAVIARGKYLVYGPAHCAECHVTMDRKNPGLHGASFTSQPLTGGLVFTLPGGALYAPNLTPDAETGIGRYSDAELARMIRHNTRPDNTIMLPFMYFGGVSDEDLRAIISYLRSAEPVKTSHPANEMGLIMKGISVAFFSTPFQFRTDAPAAVLQDTTVDYGRYLADDVSGCRFCHTNANPITGAPMGEPYAGGQQTPVLSEEQGAYIESSNLTPDPETGKMRGWTEADFIRRFRAGRQNDESIMPWEAFVNYSDNDLKAVFRYLSTLKPVKHEVQLGVVRQ